MSPPAFRPNDGGPSQTSSVLQRTMALSDRTKAREITSVRGPARRRRSSFNSHSDVTPSQASDEVVENTQEGRSFLDQFGCRAASQLEQPALSGTEQSLQSASLGVGRNSLPAEAETRITAGFNAPSPATADRFKVWFTFDGARKVVYLDALTDFEQAFETIKEKLERKLQSRELAAVVFSFDEENKLEVDEEDTWQEVLAMVKSSGRSELSGTVCLE